MISVLTNEGVGEISIRNFENLEELRILNEGVGNIEVSGLAKQLTLNTKGVGEFKGFNCKATICVVQQSGVGNIEVNVMEDLRGTFGRRTYLLQRKSRN